MGNCAGCLGADKEGDVNIREGSILARKDFSFLDQNGNEPAFSKEIIEREQDIVKLQAAWRGFHDRHIGADPKKVSFKNKQQEEAEAPYFMRDELFETLIGRDYHPEDDVVLKETFVYKSGAKYTGQWKGGFRHGLGIMEWTDGAKYEGQWQQGHASGFGMFTHINGDYYKGQWYNDKAQGVGKFMKVENKDLNQQEVTYMGEFKEDNQHGFGILKEKATNVEFKGQFQNGLKIGWGVLKNPDGSVMEGDWVSHKQIKTGIYQWPDGKSYMGEWKDSKLHGLGIYHWVDGKIYKGQYNQDKKEGFGIYLMNNGKRVYEGWWVDGKQHGLGTFVTIDNEGETHSKKGLWENGKRSIWIKDDMIESIQSSTFDFRKLMMMEDNKKRVVKDPRAHKFNPPPFFKESINQLEDYIAQQQLHHKMQEEDCCDKVTGVIQQVDEVLTNCTQ